MGWDFCDAWTTKDDVVAEITRRADGGKWVDGGRVGTCLAHKSVREGLWSVWKVTEYKCLKCGLLATPEGVAACDPDTHRPTVTRYIRFDLIRKERGSYGYKDMDESMNPYYYDCPLAFLKLANVASEEWRTKVRAYWAAATLRKEARKIARMDRGAARVED